MLAAIIANLQNVQPGPSPRPPIVKIDRGGGGQSWPRYDIVDIVHALNSFREIPGEHPVARAARRHQHVGDNLGSARETRERREAAAFLAGAALAESAAQERIDAAEARAADADSFSRLSLRELITIIDDVRGPMVAAAPEPAVRGRGQYGGDNSGGIAAVLLVGGIGVMLGVALARSW